MSDPTTKPIGIVVLCGGVGAAKLLKALCLLNPTPDITAITNTGDDMSHCGLHISPDIDTIIYTLSGRVNKKTGWGAKNESWEAMGQLKKLDKQLKYAWFNLGDKDLGIHTYRTARLEDGATLSEVTAELASNIDISILPMSNDPVRTRVTLKEGSKGNKEVSFQEYFVRLQHNVAIKAVSYKGSDTANPAPGVIESLKSAKKIIIAPSNPILSVGPILSIPEIAKVVSKRRADTTFISPIIGGKALKGPADKVMLELGYIPDAGGVAKYYSAFANHAVIDTVDENLVSVIEELGMKCIATNTIMSNKKSGKQLAETILEI